LCLSRALIPLSSMGASGLMCLQWIQWFLCPTLARPHQLSTANPTCKLSVRTLRSLMGAISQPLTLDMRPTCHKMASTALTGMVNCRCCYPHTAMECSCANLSLNMPLMSPFLRNLILPLWITYLRNKIIWNVSVSK
jgi:hypothetical protein